MRYKHNMRAALILFSAMALSACATFSNMETGLNALIGQHINTVFARIGYPQGQMQIGNETVYAWGRSFSVNMPQYNQANTTGRIGSTPYSATTGYTTYNNVEYQCNIKVIVGPDQIVRTWEFDGNIGGCDTYSRRLKTQ